MHDFFVNAGAISIHEHLYLPYADYDLVRSEFRVRITTLFNGNAKCEALGYHWRASPYHSLSNAGLDSFAIHCGRPNATTGYGTCRPLSAPF
jgi:hypothetical protein